MANNLLRINEAAERLGLREKTIRNWIYERKIDSVKLLDRSVRISENTIAELIAVGAKPRRKR